MRSGGNASVAHEVLICRLDVTVDVPLGGTPLARAIAAIVVGEHGEAEPSQHGQDRPHHPQVLGIAVAVDERVAGLGLAM